MSNAQRNIRIGSKKAEDKAKSRKHLRKVKHKINKDKNWFFVKSNKVDQSLAKLSKKSNKWTILRGEEVVNLTIEIKSNKVIDRTVNYKYKGSCGVSFLPL